MQRICTMSEPKKIKLDNKPAYFIVISEFSFKEINDYKSRIIKEEVKPGHYLEERLVKFSKRGNNLNDVSSEDFISLLLATKVPKFFAGKSLKCDGSDWTNEELKLLGDINIAVPVLIYDNGIWSVNDSKFKQHKSAFSGELLFSPGPLLKKCKKFVGQTPEFLEVIINNKIDQTKYNKLIERRLAPLFTYADQCAMNENRLAVITIPGLGCGVFAGKFKGTLGEKLNEALQNILKKNSNYYSHIACVYYDPYTECKVETKEFNGIKYRVRPFCCGIGKPQLCHPTDYQETADDDFSNCKLFKVVAWDHLSFPGNNYFVGRRVTDDGMSAAATNSMEVITGVKGLYNKGRYCPPKGMKNWEQVVLEKNVQLMANDNVRIVTDNGNYLTLTEYEQSH